MEISRVVPPMLEPARIDPDFYRPQYLATEEKLRRFGAKKFGSLGKFFAGPFGSKLPSTLYRETGMPLFRVANIGSMELVMHGMAYLSPEVHSTLASSTVVPGDLLVVKASVSEKICKVPASITSASITQHIIAVRPHRGVNVDFLCAFLFSRYGREQLLRRSLGSIIQYLGIADAKTVLIPNFGNLVVRFIGSLVSQAETSRDAARVLECRFRQRIYAAYPNLDQVADRDIKHARALASELGARLNPGAFNPDRLRVRTYLQSHKGRRVKEIADVTAPVSCDYKLNDYYIGLDSIGATLGTILPSTVEAEEVTGAVRVLSEGPVISKLRPYLNKVAYIPQHLSNAFGSTELLCVHARDVALNWYLCGVLRLLSTVRQLNPVSTGSTHPRVSREDVMECYVPWINDATNVGLMLADAQNAYFLSDKLVSSAKLLVEALIDRVISEEDISEAESRRENGDLSGYRAVLSRVYEGGIDATDTRPIFSDLDAYCETLQMAERTVASGGDE